MPDIVDSYLFYACVFAASYGGKEYEGLAPKMAIFGAEIAEVRDEIRPVVEEVLSELGIPLDKILVNVGDEKITKSEDIRDFRIQHLWC